MTWRTLSVSLYGMEALLTPPPTPNFEIDSTAGRPVYNLGFSCRELGQLLVNDYRRFVHARPWLTRSNVIL